MSKRKIKEEFRRQRIKELADAGENKEVGPNKDGKKQAIKKEKEKKEDKRGRIQGVENKGASR